MGFRSEKMDCKVTPQSISLNQSEARRAAENMNQYLANLQVLFIKLHNLHWNVVGNSFFEIHEKTQMLYENTGEMIDLVAERIKMIGFYPIGSLQEALNAATIQEIPSEDYNGPTAATVIVQDFQQMIEELREMESVTAGYDGGVISDGLSFFEKNHWMFCAYLTHV